MSSDETSCLAFDFGAGSGRAILATLRDGRLILAELLRFPGTERQGADGLHWDAQTLMQQVEAGLRAAVATGANIASVGVDSWGLDFGLLDQAGNLLADPFHYRDARSQRGYQAGRFADAELAAQTQAQVLSVNTLFQLIDDLDKRPADMQRAARLLMMADLVNHHLTGLARNELTLARTSGLHSWQDQGWSTAICAKAAIPQRLFDHPVMPATMLGPLRPDLAARCGIGRVPVITVAGHDTASALYALPLRKGEAGLIAGSWNVVGYETTSPPPRPQDAGFGIEGGAEGRALVTRSLDGFLLLRRLRADLAADGGGGPDYAALSAMARDALAQGCPQALDTTDPALLAADRFSDACARQFQRRGIPAPSGAGALALSLYLGLVARVVDGIARIEQLTGTPVSTLRIGGGGSQDRFFCDLLAAQLNRPVIAGPTEASATGNALFQLMGLGRLPSLDAARAVVDRSDMTRRILPDTDLQRPIAPPLA